MLSLPKLGLGTWGMGGYGKHDPNNDDSRDIDAIKDAFYQGIKHIDTAEIYADGHTEKLVGLALQELPRNEIILASKVRKEKCRTDDLVRSCHDSLKRLNTDYLDLYYLHSKSMEIPFSETAKALNKLLDEGLIRHIGVSNFTVESMENLQQHLDAPIAANQCHYNLVYRAPEKANILPHCRKVGANFVAWRPLMWDDPLEKDSAPGNAWDRGAYPLLDEISDKYGKSNVQTALNWLINQKNVSALVKTSNENHLREMMGALDWALSEKDIEDLRDNFPLQREQSSVVILR